MEKKEKKVTLSIPEWVNYLLSEKNREQFVFYNEEISVLTSMIVLLTGLSCLLIICSFIFTFSFVRNDTKIFLFYGAFTVMVSLVIVIGFLLLKTLPEYKKDMQRKTGNIQNIIEDILNGTLTDSSKILERYPSIWKNK